MVWVDAGVAGAHEPLSAAQVQSLCLHLAQEFHTLAGLRHPHIVSVLDYGFARDHQPYFTMELLENARTLDESSRDQPFAVRVGLLLQVLQALYYLHWRGVLNRDLKPSNILVIQAAHGLQVKLLDFGLALWTPGMNLERPEVAGTITSAQRLSSKASFHRHREVLANRRGFSRNDVWGLPDEAAQDRARWVSRSGFLVAS